MNLNKLFGNGQLTNKKIIFVKIKIEKKVT